MKLIIVILCLLILIPFQISTFKNKKSINKLIKEKNDYGIIFQFNIIKIPYHITNPKKIKEEEIEKFFINKSNTNLTIINHIIEKKIKSKEKNFNKINSFNITNISLNRKKSSNLQSIIAHTKKNITNSTLVITKSNLTNNLINVTNSNYNETIIEELEIEYYDTYPENMNRLHQFLFRNKCTLQRCSAPRGECLNKKVCRCLPGYLNNKYSKKEMLEVCGYKQKFQLYAFLFELIFLFGGNIYLGFYFYAILKAIVYLCIFLFGFYKIPCRMCGLENMIKQKCYLCPWIEYTTIIIILFGVFSWQMVDLVKIITNENKDVNGMPILDYF